MTIFSVLPLVPINKFWIHSAAQAQFVEENLIALFGFEEGETGIVRAMEKHYRLVPPDQITPDDLKLYQERLPAG